MYFQLATSNSTTTTDPTTGTTGTIVITATNTFTTCTSKAVTSRTTRTTKTANTSDVIKSVTDTAMSDTRTSTSSKAKTFTTLKTASNTLPSIQTSTVDTRDAPLFEGNATQANNVNDPSNNAYSEQKKHNHVNDHNELTSHLLAWQHTTYQIQMLMLLLVL